MFALNFIDIFLVESAGRDVEFWPFLFIDHYPKSNFTSLYLILYKNIFSKLPQTPDMMNFAKKYLIRFSLNLMIINSRSF
jgi:hypothetical protein